MLSDGGKNTVRAKQWLDKYYSKTTVKKQYADFKHGHTDTNDTKCSVCPNSAVVPENTKKHYKLVFADRKLKLREIAEELKISEGSVFTILHDHLSIDSCVQGCRVCSQSIKKRVDDSECCVQLFQCNKKEFLCKYVTMDETWIHHFILKSNWLSVEWTATGESHPK